MISWEHAMPTTHRSENEIDNVATLFDREVVTLEEFVQARPLTALAAAIIFGIFIGRFVIL
jgi:ElaB/YqjD/DUF883 family membrane-anchored ribosome-binding protein